MGISILIVVGFLASIALFRLGAHKLRGWDNWAINAGGIGAIAFGICAIVALALLLSVQINKDVEYQNALYEKEVIEHRINYMEDNIVGNEMLYHDIVEFNNDLRGVKKWANNRWTNWFVNDLKADIDYIPIKID